MFVEQNKKKKTSYIKERREKLNSNMNSSVKWTQMSKTQNKQKLQ